MNFPLFLQSVLEEEPKNIISCIHHFEFFKLFFLDQLSSVVQTNTLMTFSALSFIAAIHVCTSPYLCALVGLFLICSDSAQFLFALTVIKAGSCKTVLF